MSKTADRLVLYQSPLSPPSMFCGMVCDSVNLNYKSHEIDIINGGNRKPWYLKINPNGAVPSIKDVDGFTTNEGVAIARYVSK